MKSIYWQLLSAVILIAYTLHWSQVVPLGGDEKIYLISSALIDDDININEEHPPLVKRFYNLLLTPEYKHEIVIDETLRTRLLWIPNSYATDYQRDLLLAGGRYLRLINGLLISAFLLYVWWRSKSFMLFLSLFATLMLSDELFSCLLDGWLFVGAVGGYYLLSVGNPVGWVFSLVLGPLAKINGFVLSLFSLFDHPKSAKQFGAVCALLAFTIIVFWGAQSIGYGARHFWMQFSANNTATKAPDWPGISGLFQMRYITPFIGILMVKYWNKDSARACPSG